MLAVQCLLRSRASWGVKMGSRAFLGLSRCDSPGQVICSFLFGDVILSATPDGSLRRVCGHVLVLVTLPSWPKGREQE